MRKEDNLQVACVRYFRLKYPEKILTSFPAGYVFQGDLARRAITGKRMKDMGYLVGTPDLLIAEPNGYFHGLFIEIKIGNNKLTENQLCVKDNLTKRGYNYFVCHSIDEFITIINNHLGNI